MYRFIIFLTLLTGSLAALTMDANKAWCRILEGSPRLKGAEAGLGEAAGDTLQASLYPNPTLTFSVDDVEQFRRGVSGGDGDFAVEFSQTVLLGNKRMEHTLAGQLWEEVACWQREMIERELKISMYQALIDAAAAERKLALLHEATETAIAAENTTAGRVEAKLALETSLKKCTIARVRAELEEGRQKRVLQKAYLALAELWGGTCADFNQVDFPLEKVESLEPLETYLEKIATLPEIQMAEAKRLATCQEWHAERSDRIPDVTVGVGIATSPRFRDTYGFFDLSIPLPLFDRNQGGIMRAVYTAERHLQEEEELRLSLENSWTGIYEDLQQNFEHVMELQNLFNGEELLHTLKEGVQEHVVDPLTELEMRQTLLELKLEWIDALQEYQNNKVKVEV